MVPVKYLFCTKMFGFATVHRPGFDLSFDFMMQDKLLKAEKIIFSTTRDFVQ